MRSLYILEISPLSDMGLVKIFFHSLGCHFVLFTMLFVLQKLFNFRRSHFLIVALSDWATAAIFRKWSPVPIQSKLLPTFSSIRFSVTKFMLSSLIYLEWSFLHDGRHESICNLLRVHIQYTNTFCWKCFFSIAPFWLLCQKSDVHRCVD